MTDRVLTVAPGAQLLFDGDVCEVVELDGTRVVLRNLRTGSLAAVGLARLVTAARAVTAPVGEESSVGVVLAGP